MAQYVRLPSGRFLELGPDESAQQALMRGMQQYPAEFNLEPEKQPEGGFGAAFSAGLSRLGGEAALTAGKLGILDLPRAEELYSLQQKKAEQIFKPTEKGWTEDPLQKLKEVAGGSAAYMLAPAAAAGAAALAPVTVPVIGAAGLAAGLTSLGQYTGSNIAAQMEEGKKGLAETSGALATATAIPQAALDVLSFRMMPGIKKIFGATGKEITEAQAKALAEQTLKQKIGDYTAATGVSMGVEGATEVAQDFLEKAQAGAELTDPKARADYLESLIGGAALAGVLGPFGRGFERAGIAAKGRELEQERLTAEATAKEKERLAALEEERAFKLTPPEGLVGPETPEALQQQRLQTRLAEIEQEVERARQAKDTDTLVQLFKERTALESQVAEEVPAFERMRGLQQRISGLENLAERLQREGLEAPTAADKRAIYARLVSTNKDLREAREELEKGIEKGELPTLVDYQQLLAKEKRALTNLSKAEELKDDVKELKAAQRLEESQQQLGLFGMESFRAQEEYEAEQRRRDEEAEAARLAAQKPLLLTDQRGATPIEMGINTDLFSTPPYKGVSVYGQETLFGPAERVYAPIKGEMSLPALQKAVTSLEETNQRTEAALEKAAQSATTDAAKQTALTKLDEVRDTQKLLSRISPLILPQGGPTVETLRPQIEAVESEQQELNYLLNTRKEEARQLTTQRKEIGDQISANRTEQRRLAAQIRAEQKALSPPEVVRDLRNQIDALRKKGDGLKAQNRVLVKKDLTQKKWRQSEIATLERKLADAEKRRGALIEQREQLAPQEAPIEKITMAVGTGKVRATPRQLIADLVQDLARGADTTQSRRAVEDLLSSLERAAAEPGRQPELFETEKPAVAPPTPAEQAAARVKEVESRAERQRQTRAEIRAENERLAREAAATKQVTGLTTEQREAVQAVQARIDSILQAKETALEEKRQQKGNFRLSDALKKEVSAKKKTKEQAVEEQRTEDIKKLEAVFNAKVEKEQKKARVLREAAPTKVSRREAAEEIEAIAETQKQKRTAPVMRNVYTGKVFEPGKAPPTRDLTEAQQAKEQAEANRIAAADANVIEERYRQGLLTYAQKVLDTDLSYLGDDTVAIEYAVLDAQARKEEDAALRQGATAKEKANIKAAREVAGVLDRVISHDYAARENTPLDATTAAAVGKGDLKSALKSLAENGSTPFVRMVAKRLLPMVENTTLETASLEGKGGEFDPNTNTVTLNKDALTEEDLIHEAGHGATIGVIDAKPDELTKEQLAARDALEKLYAKMQGRAEFKDEYGNVSFKEFVSELLSNQQVRDKINQTAGLLRRIYEGFLRMLGIEPKTLSDKAAEQAFAMFSPSQASVNQQERLASIARGVFPGTATKYSSAVPKEVQDMVDRTIARTATIGDKITANLSGLRMRTFIADNWAPVEALLKMGVEKAKIKEAQALQMHVYMRLFSNQQEYTNSALLNGVPELKTDDAGVRNIEGGDAKANAQTIAAALSKASKLGNQQAVERLFTMWMASLRAKQDGVGFDKLNFKNPPTAAELAAMEQMFKDSPDVKNAFEEARRLYKEHNKRLLNLQVQTGAMSKEVADELGKGDYVGYYRVNDNGVVELMMGGSRPMRIGSVVDQPYLKELVGGEQHILPFFSSMVQNTSMLMTIALRNMQNKNTAYMFQDLGLGKIHSVPEGQQAPASKIHFKQKGEEYWFDADEAAFSAAGVPADLMMQGLQGVKTAMPALVRSLAVPADILRKAVRRLPTYTLRQTIRDPMHAWMTTGGKFTPVLSTWKELAKGMTNTSQTQMTLKEAAVVGNNVFSGDTEGVAQMLRNLSSEPSRFSQIMMKLDEFAMKGEAATRAVLYDMFRQKGMGHVEALLNTAETMNFSRRGTSASLQWLSMLTPFFNAQIQGLDSVYRSLKGDNTFEQKMNARNMLLKRGALLAASTMMYALMMEDDEAYKNATPAERYGNWFVRVPGTEATIRVPIPFELGLIFKSMPEAFVNTAFGDAKAKEAISALAKQAYMSSPFGIPTAVKGPLEIAFNYNMYSDQPIETAREKALDSDQRYRASTTEVAKLLGQFGVLSPVQIDHLVRSYTSSAGIALLSMANFALRPLTTREGVEKPERALEEMPVVGALFQPKTGRGMVNAAFDDMHRIQRAAQTYKTLAESDPEAARAYADDYAKQISLSSFAGRFRQQMGEFADYKRMIAANPNLTGAEKRAQIEAVKQQEIEYAKQLRKIAA